MLHRWRKEIIGISQLLSLKAVLQITEAEKKRAFILYLTVWYAFRVQREKINIQ